MVFDRFHFVILFFSELKIQILTTTNLKSSTLEPFPERIIQNCFSRKIVPCCNKTIVFRGKWYPVATKPWFFEENGTLLQQNDGFSRATKPDKPCPWFGSWTPKNNKNTSVPLKRECFVETLDPEKHKNYEVCSNREHWIWILDTRKP